MENFDAYDSEGISVHIYPRPKEDKKLDEAILKHLIQGINQKNRCIVESNFHVLRETMMVVILSENGFMDNKHEAMLMLESAFQKEVAVEHAKGICDYFCVTYVAVSIESSTEGTAIMGKSECAAVQLEAFLMTKNPKPKLNISVTDF